MIDLQPLAEEHDREQRREHQHQIHERPGPRRPYFLGRAVPEDIAEHRGDDAHVDEAEYRGRARFQHLAARDLERVERRRGNGADRREHGQRGQAFQVGRPPAKAHGIRRPRKRSQQHQPSPGFRSSSRSTCGSPRQTTASTPTSEIRLPTTLLRLNRSPSSAARNTMKIGAVAFSSAPLVAVGIAQPGIHRNVLEDAREQREHREDLPRAQDEAPPLAQVRPGKRQQHRERDRPAPERDRDGRRVEAKCPGDDPVARPAGYRRASGARTAANALHEASARRFAISSASAGTISL